MNILIACLTLSLVQLSIHYWLRNNIKNFEYSNPQKFSFSLQNEDITSSKDKEMLVEEKTISNVMSTNILNNEIIVLNKSLRHLEFISEFEMYLESKNYEKFPIEFFQELENIKLQTQKSILKTTNQLKGGFIQAA